MTGLEAFAKNRKPHPEEAQNAVAKDEALEASREPFGVYVHWAFCRATCPSCDFNSLCAHTPRKT